jgi:signal transduction histidine kinase
MNVLEDLSAIRQAWIARFSHQLARGEGIRRGFLAQLNTFYDCLIHSIETGNPGWLEPVLDEWVQARTASDLEEPESSIGQILEQMLSSTFEVAVENLAEGNALQLIGALFPVFTHSLQYVAQRETAAHIEQISTQLNLVRDSMGRLDKSKSDFIAIAAHELKTPLTLIEGYGSMLRERLDTLENHDQIEVLLKGIDNGTRRLREIVDDMIDVSMIDNDMLALNFQPLWANRLLEVIQREFKEITDTRKLTLEIYPFPGSREMTFGDNERLYQALRNLISNAIKYTPDGGRITVDGRLLPGFIEITVQDTGIGIDPEDHVRIFEKFGRIGNPSLHSSGKTKFKGGGPGLGLPITKGIVEAHGGTIWVESERHDEINCPGATFHLLLPVRKEPPDEKIARLFRASVEAENLEELI